MSRFSRGLLLAGAFYTTVGIAHAEPITLADALARGAEVSPRIAQAKAQLEAAEARAYQAGVGPNPEIGLQVENFGGSGPYRSFRQTETTLAVSQRFELGGKRSARKAVARAERDFTALAFIRAQADLARDIRYAHAELRADEDRAVLAREHASRARTLASTAGLLVEAGRDPPLRKLRADALLAEAEAEAARAFGELLASRRLLATLTGSEDPELTAIGDDLAPAPASLPAEIQTLDERLSAAERDAASARIKLAQSEGVPDLTALGGVRQFRESGATAILAGISIPIPIRNRNRGGIAAARSDTAAAEAVLAQTRLDSRRLRRDAEVQLAASNQRLAVLAGPSLGQAAEAMRLADIGYRAGKFSLIELIDAQNAHNSAKLALIDAQLDRARALADLARANAQ